MKITRVANLFLQFDILRKRIDLRRPTAYVISLIVAVLWALNGYADISDLAVRTAAALLFVLLGKLLIEGLASSRIASLVIVSVLLCIGASADVSELMLVSTYMSVLLLAQLYFILRSKTVSLGVTLAAGIVIGSAGSHMHALLLLFVTAMILRVIWHGVLERIARKPFVLFSAKAAIMAVLVPLIAIGVEASSFPSLDLVARVSLPHLPVWALVVFAVLILRGIWATLLLRTDRSPKHRALRLFYACYGSFLLVLVATTHHYGDRIFLPAAINSLSTFGLTGYGIVAWAYATLALGLFLAAAIDRTLYKDTRISRAVQQVL